MSLNVCSLMVYFTRIRLSSPVIPYSSASPCSWFSIANYSGVGAAILSKLALRADLGSLGSICDGIKGPAFGGACILMLLCSPSWFCCCIAVVLMPTFWPGAFRKASPFSLPSMVSNKSAGSIFPPVFLLPFGVGLVTFPYHFSVRLRAPPI